MQRVLYLYRDSSFARFIRDDAAILRSRYTVDEIRLDASPATLTRLLWSAARSDLVYFWWGDLTGLLGASMAALQGKPSVMVTGGYDIANVPEIRYGLRYHPWRKRLPPLVLKWASEIIANAQISGDSVVRDFGIAEARVHVIPHGLDAAAITPGDGVKERRVLTCSLLSRDYIPYKGLDTFVRTAAMLPDVPFVHAGPHAKDGALEALQKLAGPNVQFLGFQSEVALIEEMRRALVYAQLSAHEGFGLALAEAMLAGATPVVTRAGAIPEVVGEVGEYVDYGDAAGTARAIERALAAPRGAKARQRIVENFPLSRRRDGVLKVVEQALAKRSRH